MEQLPSLIADLALILITAGVVAILFRRLRQPLVLGYIVAGFLVGPHMPWTPTVADSQSISTWANIGVIFLMFSLGLEFSFKKILKMGSAPIIAACCVMACMFGVGNMVGHAFGWGATDSMFLGGMLAMSSTTIIYKALADLGMNRQKFAAEVLSVLVLEDILGILLMVVLSAVAVSRHFEGLQLAASFVKLAFFLILWFVVGMFVVPLFLRRAGRWLNGETLLIVSIGMCFFLVVYADKVGYSSAFGAFMMGSILAETLEAESIERVTAPVKDLFGAIFFVSVGMMVDPQILSNYWLPITIIIVSVVVGQAVFGTMSFLLSGQPLRVSLQCGFSLGQIGEFAFIIASMGVQLGVTSEYLYPVVVAVSIITTFLTPYMIRAADPVYRSFEQWLPHKFMQRVNAEREAPRFETPKTDTPVSARKLWQQLLTFLAVQVAIYSVLSTAVGSIVVAVFRPIARSIHGIWDNGVLIFLAVALLSPFLRAIVVRKNNTSSARQLRQLGPVHRHIVYALFWVRYFIASGFVFLLLEYLSPLPWVVHVILAIVSVFVIIRLRVIKYVSIRMERTFMHNLRLRDFQAQASTPSYARRLLSYNLHTASVQVPAGSTWAGHRLSELNFGHDLGITIAAVERGAERINIPDGQTVVFPGDSLLVISDDEGLARFSALAEASANASQLATHHPLLLRRIHLVNHPSLVGKALGESALRETYQCTVVGFESEGGALDSPSASRVLQRSDTLWLVGEEEDLRKLQGEK